MRTAKGLTDEEIQTFHEQGYLVVEDLFTDDELQGVIDEIHAEINARARQFVEAGKLPQTYEEAGFLRQLALISEHSREIAKSVWNGLLSGPAIFDLIRNPKLLDVAESLCGPELIASSVYRIRPKIPGFAYGAVPWHQDSGYLEPYCDKGLVVTVWLPLVDATVDNGCLYIIPRTHRGRIRRHEMDDNGWYLRIPDDELPEGERIPVPVPKGGVLLMTNLTPHASFVNHTDIVRWSMDLRYQSAELPTNATITRTHEELDKFDEEGAPPACFPPEADFLVRSRRRPQEVVKSAELFHRLRTDHQAIPVSDRWSQGGPVDWSHKAAQVKD